MPRAAQTPTRPPAPRAAPKRAPARRASPQRPTPARAQAGRVGDAASTPPEADRVRGTLDIGGHKVHVTNLDKVLYPKVGFTKGQVIDYYIRVSPWLLPHIADRALTLKRYPNGVAAPFFYQKECPANRPDWMDVASIWS